MRVLSLSMPKNLLHCAARNAVPAKVYALIRAGISPSLGRPKLEAAVRRGSKIHHLNADRGNRPSKDALCASIELHNGLKLKFAEGFTIITSSCVRPMIAG
jgi:hypothetical protein